MVAPCRRCNGTGREPDMAAFGDAVRTARQRKGWSLRELARRAECTPAFVSDMENGKRGGGFDGRATLEIMRLLNVKAPR